MNALFRCKAIVIGSLIILLVSGWSLPSESPSKPASACVRNSRSGDKNVFCPKCNPRTVEISSKIEWGKLIEKVTGETYAYGISPDFYVFPSDFLDNPQNWTVIADNAALAETLHQRIMEAQRRNMAKRMRAI